MLPGRVVPRVPRATTTVVVPGQCHRCGVSGGGHPVPAAVGLRCGRRDLYGDPQRRLDRRLVRGDVGCAGRTIH
ncbi:hypothetical protein GCM10023403_11720 [Pseudonocardia benzenivorans]|nr:hypothetical protein PSD17_43190 [Pseudonocardia sp. D17]